jgi:hypothetical protein
VSNSVIDVFGYIERFLALHLKEDESAAAELERCKVFRTGAMAWEALDDWPSPDARPMEPASIGPMPRTHTLHM